MSTGGRNMGRVGVITHRERHDGGFNIVHIKDAVDNEFATRESNVFIIGKEKPWISLPKGKGVKVRLNSALVLTNDTDSHSSSALRRNVIAAGHILLLAGKYEVRVMGICGDVGVRLSVVVEMHCAAA
jgi:hypothetical protein